MADGHEKSNSTTTTTLATGITSVGNLFIIEGWDWATAGIDYNGALRIAQWSKTDGTGVCPVGFRVPTKAELESETTGYGESDNTTTGAVKVTNFATAFANFLKFPVAGSRQSNGTVYGQGSLSSLSTISLVNEHDLSFINFNNISANWYDTNLRASGFSVRCVEGN